VDNLVWFCRVNPRVIYEQYGIPIGTRGTNPANSQVLPFETRVLGHQRLHHGGWCVCMRSVLQAVTAFEQQYISVSDDLSVCGCGCR
jgi:hypothetical protein